MNTVSIEAFAAGGEKLAEFSVSGRTPSELVTAMHAMLDMTCVCPGDVQKLVIVVVERG